MKLISSVHSLLIKKSSEELCLEHWDFWMYRLFIWVAYMFQKTIA